MAHYAYIYLAREVIWICGIINQLISWFGRKKGLADARSFFFVDHGTYLGARNIGEKMKGKEGSVYQKK